MRLAALLLLASLPLAAQFPGRRWSFGLHGLPASLEGSLEGTVDGDPISLDLKSDLNLGKDRTQPGAFAEYQGPRFGFMLAADGQDYQGHAILARPVTLQGVTYLVGTPVDSRVKLRNYDLDWTVRVLRWQPAWIGVDLGARVWDVDMRAWGYDTYTLLPTEPRPSAQRITIPIPQVGLSVGGRTFGDRIAGRASFHFLRYKGATYRRWQGDLRYFPLPWLGLRAFLDDESLAVPKDSLKDDLSLDVDRTGAGFGVVVRF